MTPRLHILTVAQAAAQAGISEGHIRKICASGVLVATAVGKRGWAIRPADLERWIKEGNHTPGRKPTRRAGTGED